MPGLVPGQYYVLVRTDSLNQVAEMDKTNNLRVSASTFGLAMNALSVGTPVSDVLSQGESCYYQVDVLAGKHLQVALSDSTSSDSNEVYIKFGTPPTRSNFDYRYSALGSANQNVLALNSEPGTWYVLVYGASVPAPSSYTLLATAADVVLRGSSPNDGGTSVDSVLTLTGVGFAPQSVAQLVAADGTAYSAANIAIPSAGQMTATFPAGSVPAGTYTVRVLSPDGTSSELPNAFTMIEGGLPHLTTTVIAPSVIGYHAPSTIYVQYANTGTAAMPAPLLTLTATQNNLQGAFLTLDQSRANESFWQGTIPAGYATSVSFIASGATPGLLQPGESVTIPVHYAGWITTQWNFSRPPIYFNIGTLTADDTQPIDWTAFGSQTQPTAVNATAWAAVVKGLSAQIGTTWGDYVTALDSDAVRLAMRRQSTIDASALLAFETTKAEGLPVGVVTGQVVDATTGKPLAGVVVNDLSTDDRSAASATTDANGLFTLTGLHDGVQNLTMTGYLLAAPAAVTVTTTADALGVELQATAAAQITGRVTDSSTKLPLANAVVECTGTTSGETFQTQTASDGSYSFDTLPADAYTVSVSAKGYVSSSTGGIVAAWARQVSMRMSALWPARRSPGPVRSQAGAVPLARATIFGKAKLPALIRPS